MLMELDTESAVSILPYDIYSWQDFEKTSTNEGNQKS